MTEPKPGEAIVQAAAAPAVQITEKPSGPPLTGTLLDFLESRGAPADTAAVKGFREGVRAEHPLGVLYQGPWEEPGDGFQEHVRRVARAIQMAGCPVHLRSLLPSIRFGLSPAAEEVIEAHDDLAQASIQAYGVSVHQVVPRTELLERLMTPSQSAMRILSEDDILRMNRHKVIYTVWERSPVPEPAVRALNAAGQAWVACQANAKMLEACGVEADKIRVVPIPYFDADPLLALEGRKRLGGVVRFYHIGKWEPRKDQHRILGAFLRAFKKGEAELYLKTSKFAPKTAGYPQGAVASLLQWLKDPLVQENGWSFAFDEKTPPADIGKELGYAGIKIYEAMLTTAQIQALHRIGDVYVSLSHGEGFDMPAFDAKLAGNLLVYTPSGGPQDFAGELDERIAPSGEIATHPIYGWPAGSTYLDYELDDAVAALRRARETVLKKGRVRGMDITSFRAASVGKRALGYLKEICPELPGGA